MDFSQILLPLGLATGGAIGWVARRLITGQHHKEDAESIRQAVELKIYLDEKSITLPQARQMRDNLRQGRQPVSPAMARALIEGEATSSGIDSRIDFRDTNVGMRLGMSMRLDQLDAEISYLVTALSHDATSARQLAIEASQIAWMDFRAKDGEVAELLWDGGTGAVLLNLSRQVEICEVRKEELNRMVAEQTEL